MITINKKISHRDHRDFDNYIIKYLKLKYFDGRRIDSGALDIYFDNAHIKGNFEDGNMHGYFRFFYEGTLRVIQRFADNIPHGPGFIFYDNGRLQIRNNFSRGRKHGKMVTYYKNGILRSHGHVVNNRHVDIWSFYDPNGNFIQSYDYTHKDQNSGLHVSYDYDGKVTAKINYEKGLRNGMGVYFNNTHNTKLLVNFLDGKPHKLRENIEKDKLDFIFFI